MKIDDNLIEQIEKNFIIRQSIDSDEILTTASRIDPDSLDYWDEYPFTQKMLEIGSFTAFIFSNKDAEEVAVLVTSLEEEGRIWIEILSVTVGARKAGLTKLLIDVVKNIGSHHNARIVLVDTDNGEDRYTFEMFGFKQLGTINNFYPDSSETVIMGYLLDPR